MHDLVIRGATVVDGLGHDPIRADVAVKDGRIAAIGEVGKDASEIVDAGGLALMPGIIDLHTHYDAQVTWDPTLSPSPSLGVTTAVMGNCEARVVDALNGGTALERHSGIRVYLLIAAISGPGPMMLMTRVRL
jgi:N-acyl-D-amino-acid deacylase